MNKEEAEKIIRILFTADGGCHYCVEQLIDMFTIEFPEYKKLAKEMLIIEFYHFRK